MGDVQAPTGFQDDIAKVYPHSKMEHIDIFSPPKHRDIFFTTSLRHHGDAGSKKWSMILKLPYWKEMSTYSSY